MPLSPWTQLAWDTELFGPLLLTEDIVTEPPLYRDFHLHVPRTPGLGLTLDEERLAFFRRDKTTKRKPAMLFHVKMTVKLPVDMDPAGRQPQG